MQVYLQGQREQTQQYSQQYYQRAVGYAQPAAPMPSQVAWQGTANRLPTSAAPNTPMVQAQGLLCPAYLDDVECDRKKQIAALQTALEELEGQLPVPLSLDGAIQNLEVALETLQPGALAEFRRWHLAAAFNAVGTPPKDGDRASSAARALSSVQWQPGSMPGSVAPVVSAALAQLRATAEREGSASLLGELRATVRSWLPWSRVTT
jgi:hypothetical protein